jgi:hypothetical protein
MSAPIKVIKVKASKSVKEDNDDKDCKSKSPFKKRVKAYKRGG